MSERQYNAQEAEILRNAERLSADARLIKEGATVKENGVLKPTAKQIDLMEFEMRQAMPRTMPENPTSLELLRNLMSWIEDFAKSKEGADATLTEDDAERLETWVKDVEAVFEGEFRQNLYADYCSLATSAINYLRRRDIRHARQSVQSITHQLQFERVMREADERKKKGL
jgi:hypothetical protein